MHNLFGGRGTQMKMLKGRLAVLLVIRRSVETVQGRSITFDTRDGLKVNDR
jgi:hypothetical protein